MKIHDEFSTRETAEMVGRKEKKHGKATEEHEAEDEDGRPRQEAGQLSADSGAERKRSGNVDGGIAGIVLSNDW